MLLLLLVTALLGGISHSRFRRLGVRLLMCTFAIDILVLIDALIFLSISNELVKTCLPIIFQFAFVDQLTVMLGPVDQVPLFRLIFRWPSFMVAQKIHIHLPHHRPPLLMRHHTAFVL